MKLNKKGFTLIELLAVLVILITITLIAIPSITSSLERNKEKQYKAKVELIISYAELYASDKKININTLCITTDTLLEEGYTTRKELKHPKDETAIIKGKIYYDNTSKELAFIENQTCS